MIFLTQLDSTNDYIPRDLDFYYFQICQRTDVSNIYFLKSFSSSISKLFDLPVLDCRLDLIHHPQHLPESLVVLTKSYRENHPVTSQEWFSTCSEEFALRSNCRFLLQVTALRYAHLNTDIKLKHTLNPIILNCLLFSSAASIILNLLISVRKSTRKICFVLDL